MNHYVTFRVSHPDEPGPQLHAHCGVAGNTARWGFCVFSLALLLRVGYAIVAPSIDPFLIQDPLLGDAASYDRIARTLLAGGAYGEQIGQPSAFWPPLYPYVLAAIYAIFGYDLMVARVIQAIIGAVLPLTVFLAGHHLGETKLARWASLGAVVYPYLVYFGAWLVAESLFFALSGMSLWMGAKLQQRPSYRRAVFLGLLIGLAALAKPTILMQLPFMVIWFLLCLRPVRLPRRFLLGVATALVVLLTVMPWTVRNYRAFGHPVLISTNGGYTFYGANNGNAFGGHYEHFPPRIVGLSEAEEQAEFYRLGTTWISENPGQFAWLTAQKFRRLASPLSVASAEQDFYVPGSWFVYLSYSVFLLVAFYGLLVSLRRWRQFFLLYIPILGVIVSTFLFYGDARYTLPAVPSLLFFGVMGGYALVAKVRFAS